jgi:hypothetical protein
MAQTTDQTFGAGVSAASDPFAFSAQSGPNGENPRGWVVVGGILSNSEGPVTCLRVEGNLATIGARIERSFNAGLIGQGIIGYSRDNGPFTNGGPVDSGAVSGVPAPPTSCPAPDPVQASIPLFGELTNRDDSTLPPPPADPAWAIGRGRIPGGGLSSDFAFGAMALDGETIGWGTLGTVGAPNGGGVATCLRVSGNTAAIGLQAGAVDDPIFGAGANLTAVDGRPTGSSTGSDSFAATAVPSRSGVNCSSFSATTSPLDVGEIVVHAGTPPPPSRPTSKDECKNGGWKTFGVFKNQGDCVSFIATKGKNPPAKRP